MVLYSAMSSAKRFILLRTIAGDLIYNAIDGCNKKQGAKHRSILGGLQI